MPAWKSLMPLRHETMSVQLQSDNSNQHPHDTHGPDIHASVIHVGIVCHCQDDCGISELTPAQERSHAPIAFGIGYLVPAGREARGGPGKPARSTASIQHADRGQAEEVHNN